MPLNSMGTIYLKQNNQTFFQIFGVLLAMLISVLSTPHLLDFVECQSDCENSGFVLGTPSSGFQSHLPGEPFHGVSCPDELICLDIAGSLGKGIFSVSQLASFKKTVLSFVRSVFFGLRMAGFTPNPDFVLMKFKAWLKILTSPIIVFIPNIRILI